MQSKNKFFSFLTLAIATLAFATIGFGQDKTTTTAPATTDAPQKAERPFRGEGRGFGKGEGRGFGHGHRGGFGRGAGMFRMMHDLNLTDAQKTQIHQIMEANKPDEATMAELRAIRESRKPGTELTAEQKDRLKAIREQMHAKGKGVHEQILSVLTAEQRAQLEKRKAEMKQRMEERKLQRQQNPRAPRAPKAPETPAPAEKPNN